MTGTLCLNPEQAPIINETLSSSALTITQPENLTAPRQPVRTTRAAPDK
jgi:hypothetical protein